MGSDAGAHERGPAAGAHERGPAAETGNRFGWLAPNRAVRAASALAGAAVSMAAWEIGTTLRFARLASDLAIRVSADLAGRAGQAVGPLAGAPRSLPEELNRALVLRLYRAAVQADLTAASKLFAPDVRWRVPGPEPAAGKYRGIAEMVPALGAIWGQLGGIQAIELRDVISSPERAAALLRLSVVRNGRPAVLDWWVLLRIERGQVTRAWGPFSTEQEP